MTEKRWSFGGRAIVGTDICEKGIPHTNRSIVTHLNRYEKKIKELKEENEQLKKELKELNKKYIAFSEATDKRLKELYSGDVE